MMVFEQHGVPKDQNYYWYERRPWFLGFPDVARQR